MARMSAAERAASAFRSGAEWPQPPRSIGRRAASIWREVVAARAPDYFHGHLSQLTLYCRTMAECERLLDELGRCRSGSVRSRAISRDLSTLTAVAAVHGRQLRIPVLSKLAAGAGVLHEHPGNGLAGDPLIGGSAIRH